MDALSAVSQVADRKENKAKSIVPRRDAVPLAILLGMVALEMAVTWTVCCTDDT